MTEDITRWQYIQLTVTYDNRLTAGDGKWTIAWHRPDTTTQVTVGSYEAVVAELNRAGIEGATALGKGDIDNRAWADTAGTKY
jgi:hypothetical protein